METRLGQLGGTAHRCVEPVHHSAWPVQKPKPFHETLSATNQSSRDADGVDFSDELRRLNSEQRLRELRCDESGCSGQAEQAATTPAKPPHVPELQSDTTELVRTVEHRYEVTHRSTTGRLIDMLM